MWIFKFPVTRLLRSWPAAAEVRPCGFKFPVRRLSRGYGSFVASLMHGAKVVIKPIQTFFYNWLVVRDMARVEEDMAFP